MQKTFGVFSLWMIYDTHNVVKQILKRLTFVVVQGQPRHCLVWLLRVFLLIPLFMALGIPEENSQHLGNDRGDCWLIFILDGILVR